MGRPSTGNTDKIAELYELGLTVVPLSPNTKHPLVRWGQYMHRRQTVDELVNDFAKYPFAEIGIITGRGSGVVVLDMDAPPYLDNDDKYITTPSGGRHYYYKYHGHEHFGVGVRPHVDIPHLVKYYGEFEINDGPIPIQPDLPRCHRDVRTSEIPWDESQKIPSMEDIRHCRFIAWYLERRDDDSWDGRYPLARAYASNVAHCRDPDTRLGHQYQHQDDIYSKLGRPIRCSTIVDCGYDCPDFHKGTLTCSKYPGVASPYGLAARITPPPT